MANVFVSVGKALIYSVNNTFKKPLRWLLLVVFSILEILCFLPASTLLSAAFVRGFWVDAVLGTVFLILSLIFVFFFLGLAIKIMGRHEIRMRNFFETVWCGLKVWCITILYLLIPIIVTVSLVIVGFITSAHADPASAVTISSVLGGLDLWNILLGLLFLICTVFLIPALLAFARQNRFSSAFQRKEVGGLIRDVKWYWIVVGIFVFSVVLLFLSFLSSFVSGLLVLIPVVGTFFAFLVNLILLIFIFFFTADYWAEVFT